MEHAKFHHHIKEVAIKHGLVAGKWMAFVNGKSSSSTIHDEREIEVKSEF